MAHCVQMLPKIVSVSHDVPEKPSLLSITETEIPVEIQQVIDQYQEVFKEPTELPPRRAYDHQITLMPGAQPVNVRPYRYAPTQKTEIEKQLA